MSDTDELTDVIKTVTDLWDEPLDEIHDIPQIVNAILVSDWLASRHRDAYRSALADAAHDLTVMAGFDSADQHTIRQRLLDKARAGGAQ